MPTENNLSTIEKVIFLKSVDIFEHATVEQLGRIAGRVLRDVHGRVRVQGEMHAVLLERRADLGALLVIELVERVRRGVQLDIDVLDAMLGGP